MGIVSSKELTGSSIEQPTHVASEGDQQIATPLSSISLEIFEELNRIVTFLPRRHNMSQENEKIVEKTN